MGKITMVNSPDEEEVETPEMRKWLALLERADRRSWRQFIQGMVALAMGVAIADVLALLLIGFCLFWTIR